MNKTNNRLSVAQQTQAPGDLTDEQVKTLLKIMPKDAWDLIHNLFTGKSTTFTAPLVKPAATVQEFSESLRTHPCFTG